MLADRKRHTLVVVNPGHFHAALTMRKRHPLLSDEVHVYSEDSPELRDFLHLVNAFNQCKDDPTSWGLHIYRGAEYQALCPGVGYRAQEKGWLITMPAPMHQGHEARFAEVLDRFLGYVDEQKWPHNVSRGLVTRYTLLAKAHELSRR